MRKGRVLLLVLGSAAIVALGAWMFVGQGGLPAAATERTGLSHREALLGLLTLGVLGLAAYGFDLRDWF
jgi:hypothetical protein